MGRIKANQVIEHRLSLGLKEREYAEAYVTGNLLKGGTIAVAGVTAAVGLVAAGLAVWFTSKKLYGWGEELAKDLDDWTSDIGGSWDGDKKVGIKEAILGKPIHTYPDGREVINPAAGIPIFGSLVGSGINVGMKWNPFD